MVPKFTTGSVAVSWLWALVDTPDRLTTADAPLVPAIVKEPVAVPTDVGAYITCTVTVWPGGIVAPTAGTFVMVNRADGGVTEVIVCVVVPRLEMFTVWGIWIPSGTGMTPWSGASGNVCVDGVAYSPSSMPSAISGTATVGKVDELVLGDSEPLLPPGTAGVNFV